MKAGYGMERQQELQVNTTKIAKMKKRLTKEQWRMQKTGMGGKQLQSRDMFVKYKHNFVGVKEQLN